MEGPEAESTERSGALGKQDSGGGGGGTSGLASGSHGRGAAAGRLLAHAAQAFNAGRLLVKMTVDLGGGKSGTLVIHENDDAGDVARAFCSTHGLSEVKVVPKLQRVIEAEKTKATERMAAAVATAWANKARGSLAHGSDPSALESPGAQGKPATQPAVAEAATPATQSVSAGGSGGSGVGGSSSSATGSPGADRTAPAAMQSPGDHARRAPIRSPVTVPPSAAATATPEAAQPPPPPARHSDEGRPPSPAAPQDSGCPDEGTPRAGGAAQDDGAFGSPPSESERADEASAVGARSRTGSRGTSEIEKAANYERLRSKHAPTRHRTAPSGKKGWRPSTHNTDSQVPSSAAPSRPRRARKRVARKPRGKKTIRDPNATDETVFERLYKSGKQWHQTKKEVAASLEPPPPDYRDDAPATKPGAVRSRKGVSAGERLFYEGVSNAKRKAEYLAAERAKSEQDENWECPRCAHENAGADGYCRNMLKSGEIVVRDDGGVVERRCGMRKPAPFEPTISEFARNLDRVGGAVARKTRSSGDETRRRLLKREFQEAELSECVFRPTINPRSKQIANRQRRESAAASVGDDDKESASGTHHDVAESLYADARRRRMQQHEEPEDFPFHPDIGPEKLRRRAEPTREAFFERLANEGKTKEEELQRKRKELAEIDPDTGRRLFHPETGRSPTFQRNSARLPIGEFLFASRHESDDIRKKLEEEQAEAYAAQANARHVARGSKRRLALLRRRQFAALFAVLQRSAGQEVREVGRKPSDLRDEVLGQLNVHAAKTDALRDARLVRAVGAALEFLKARHGGASSSTSVLVSCTEFEAALAPRLGGVPTSDLLGTVTEAAVDLVAATNPKGAARGESSDDAEATFAPKIDERSKLLANGSRGAGQPVYERLTERGQQYEKRRQELASQVQRREVEECTFRPRILRRGKHTHVAPARYPFGDTHVIDRADRAEPGDSGSSHSSGRSAAALHSTAAAAVPAMPSTSAVSLGHLQRTGSGARQTIRGKGRARSRRSLAKENPDGHGEADELVVGSTAAEEWVPPHEDYEVGAEGADEVDASLSMSDLEHRVDAVLKRAVGHAAE